MLYDTKDNEEEASLGHEGESSLSKSSDSSDDEDEEDDGTSAKDINGDGNCDNGGGRNTCTIGGSIEWIRFLSPGAQTEALGATAKAEAPSPTASRKKNKAGRKVRVKYHRRERLPRIS